METTRPRISHEFTGGSSWPSRSPRVIRQDVFEAVGVDTTRWTKNRPPREKRTISPTEISSSFTRRTETTSPGRTEGAMLVPRTRRRIPLNDRTISSNKAIDAFSLVPANLLSTRLRRFPADSAVVFRRVHLAASQGRDFEHLIETEQRWDIRLFGCRLRFLCLLARRVVLIQVSRSSHEKTPS